MAWLIDKSAFVRLASSPDAGVWATRIERGLVRVSTTTLLQLGASSRSGHQLRSFLERPPLSVMPVENQTPVSESRALEIQVTLADRGHRRSLSVPDLLVAAVAEVAGLTVLHLGQDPDQGFELIAEVTGQPVERLRIA